MIQTFYNGLQVGAPKGSLLPYFSVNEMNGSKLPTNLRVTKSLLKGVAVEDETLIK